MKVKPIVHHLQFMSRSLSSKLTHSHCIAWGLAAYCCWMDLVAGDFRGSQISWYPLDSLWRLQLRSDVCFTVSDICCKNAHWIHYTGVCRLDSPVISTYEGWLRCCRLHCFHLTLLCALRFQNAMTIRTTGWSTCLLDV